VSRRTILSVLLLAALLRPALPAAAQDQPACSPDSGTVITRQIESEALSQAKSYNVYVPPDWCHLDDLPLLVMLHGLNGDHTDWVTKGHIDDTADRLILSGDIQPLVILMPDGDNSFYVDGPDGDYETYVVSELVNAVDETFPTAATRDARFIGGLSMGGYGALYLGLRHPDLFSAIGAHSAAIFLRNSPDLPWIYGEQGELFEEFDPASMIRRDGWPTGMRLFIDYGSADRLMLALYDLVVAIFDQPGINYQIHIWPGVHDWSYWSVHAADYLRFYVGTGTGE
jgi:S-formylglutathione hydrolase FrmB